MAPFGAAGEQQIRDIGRGHYEHESHGAEQEEHRRAKAAYASSRNGRISHAISLLDCGYCCASVSPRRRISSRP